MKKTKQFLRPLLMAIVMMVGMLVPQGAWASMTLLTEEGNDYWCEDLSTALEVLTSLRESGVHVTTMFINENTALSEELDCQQIGQDITIDLNGCVLTNDPRAADFMSCIVVFPNVCENRITIQNGTIESNELNAIYFQGVEFNHHQKLILKDVNVVTRQEGRHCLFDAMSWERDDWGYDGYPESSPKLQIINSQFHSNGCSAISFTLLRNDEYVKSILPEGYSFYNANTGIELKECVDRPFVDENGNPATDIRTGKSPDLPKIKISDSKGYEKYCGNFKQAMDIYGSYGMTLTLLDDVKEGLCTTNCNCRSVTIDLNGHTLDITRLYANGEYLKIIDSSEGKTGKLIVERFDVETPAENNAVIEGNVITLGDDYFTNNGLVEYVDGVFINNGDFITSWTWADDHSSATLRINHEDLDAVVTNEDTTPATCIASGVRTYTAAATYRDRNYADTKDEEIAIDPNAHSYTNNTLTASPVEDGLYAYACDNGCGTHTDDHIIKDFNGEGNHLELTKDGEGNYSTSEDITLADGASFSSPVDFTANSVTYTRTMSNEWGTLCLPFEIESDQDATCKFYELKEVKETEIVLTEVSGNIPAGTPVLVRRNAEGTNISLNATNAAITVAPAAGSSANGFSLVGRFTASGALPADSYIISNNKFWRVSDLTSDVTDVKVGPFRAYLQSNGVQNVKMMSLSIGDDTTGIVETLNDFTDGDAEFYDLNGKRQTDLQRGVNIVKRNGKTMKVIIK